MRTSKLAIIALLMIFNSVHAVEFKDFGLGVGVAFGGDANPGVNADIVLMKGNNNPIFNSLNLSVGAGFADSKILPSIGLRYYYHEKARLSVFYSDTATFEIDGIRSYANKPYLYDVGDLIRFKGLSLGAGFETHGFQFDLFYVMSAKRDGLTPTQFYDTLRHKYGPNDYGKAHDYGLDGIFDPWHFNLSVGYNF